MVSGSASSGQKSGALPMRKAAPRTLECPTDDQTEKDVGRLQEKTPGCKTRGCGSFGRGCLKGSSVLAGRTRKAIGLRAKNSQK